MTILDGAGAEYNIGPHRLRITGDTVLTRYVGVPEYEQVLEIHRHLDRVKAEHGRLFVINDMRHSGVPATETRRYIAEWASRNAAGTELVNFGMSLSIRAVQALVLRAAALIGKASAIVPEHCEDEAAAYAWVARRRALRGR